VENPRGVAFDSQGRLLVLSGKQLLRFAKAKCALGKPDIVIANGLEDPRHVITDPAGNFYISDRGAAHQVKVFSPTGKLARVIGKPGAPGVGPYDPLHLNNPNGLAFDSQGRLWIAEADNAPRRVSVWSSKGELVRAFYGPH
jgi:streptogramin lyase